MRSRIKGWIIPIVWILTIAILWAIASLSSDNAWKGSPLYVFLGAMVARFVYEKMYPTTMLSYKMIPDLKQVLVWFDNTQTIVLKNGSKRIEIHLTPNRSLTPKRELWMTDSGLGNISEVVVTDPGRLGRKVYLQAGEFFVTRSTTGYIISWEDGDWEVAHILD
jgi:hypothetical protein